MIEMITPFIRHMEVQAIVPYQNFLHAQSRFIQEKHHRFEFSQGHESAGVKLLRYILQFVDLEYLDSQVNNYERYTNHLRYIRKDLMNIFDRVQRGRGYKNLFFDKHSFLTEEFLLPIEDVNSITNLPLYTEDWEIWKHVRTLRLWYHNSEEYTLHLLHDRVRFKKIPPAYSIELLDVVALVFKYYIWYKHQRQNEPAKELAEYIPQQLFLHKYVMCDWVWDLSNIWLLNCLQRLVRVHDFDELNTFESHSLQLDQNYGWVTLQSRRGFESLWKIIQDTTKNRRPEALLSSPLLFGGSINSRIKLTENTLVLPINQPYEYLRWLRDKDLMNLFMYIWMQRPDLPTTKKICIQVQREFQRMLKRRPWQSCQNVLLKKDIEEEMSEQANLFQL